MSRLSHALIGQYFQWPGLATTVEGYVRSCDACERNKVVRHAPFGLLSPFPIPSRPWLSVSLDWITDLPPSHYHDAILVVVDRLTKQAIFVPRSNLWQHLMLRPCSYNMSCEFMVYLKTWSVIEILSSHHIFGGDSWSSVAFGPIGPAHSTRRRMGKPSVSIR